MSGPLSKFHPFSLNCPLNCPDSGCQEEARGRETEAAPLVGGTQERDERSGFPGYGRLQRQDQQGALVRGS